MGRIARTRIVVVGALMGTLVALTPVSAAAAASPTGLGVSVEIGANLNCSLYLAPSPGVGGLGEGQAFGKTYAPEAWVYAQLQGAACGQTSGRAYFEEAYASPKARLFCQQAQGTYKLSGRKVTLAAAAPLCTDPTRGDHAYAHAMSASFVFASVPAVLGFTSVAVGNFKLS